MTLSKQQKRTLVTVAIRKMGEKEVLSTDNLIPFITWYLMQTYNMTEGRAAMEATHFVATLDSVIQNRKGN